MPPFLSSEYLLFILEVQAATLPLDFDPSIFDLPRRCLQSFPFQQNPLLYFALRTFFTQFACFFLENFLKSIIFWDRILSIIFEIENDRYFPVSRSSFFSSFFLTMYTPFIHKCTFLRRSCILASSQFLHGFSTSSVDISS